MEESVVRGEKMKPVRWVLVGPRHAANLTGAGQEDCHQERPITLKSLTGTVAVTAQY
jgi:hypothetical protein